MYCLFMEKIMKLFELTTEIICRRPPRWQTHLRYALHLPGQEVTLPAGTWLLELEVGNDNTLYRLADGTFVSLPGPLLESEATLFDHSEAVRSIGLTGEKRPGRERPLYARAFSPTTSGAIWSK
jgi:hypothetical protein